MGLTSKKSKNGERIKNSHPPNGARCIKYVRSRSIPIVTSLIITLKRIQYAELSVLLFCFLHHSYEFDDPQFVKMKNAMDDVTAMFAEGFTISDFLPILTYLPFDPPDVRKMKANFSVIFDMLREKIRTHKETYEAGK